MIVQIVETSVFEGEDAIWLQEMIGDSKREFSKDLSWSAVLRPTIIGLFTVKILLVNCFEVGNGDNTI